MTVRPGEPSRRKPFGTVLLSVLAIAGFAWWLLTQATVRSPADVRAEQLVHGLAASESPASRTSPPSGPAPPRETATATLRERVLEALDERASTAENSAASPTPATENARGEASPAPTPQGANGSADVAPTGRLPVEYVRTAIAEMLPLVRECYNDALHTAPQLEGRLVAKLVIAADARLGGVVESVEIDGASTLRDASLEECVRETLYTAELPAPDGGNGRVNISYPFVLSPRAR